MQHASQAPTRTALVIQDCKDTLNALGNCYPCNKPGTWRETAWIKPRPERALMEDRRDSLTAIIAINKGIWPITAAYLRRIEVWGPWWPQRWRRYARRWWYSATRSQGIFSRGTNCWTNGFPSSDDDKCEMNVNFNKNHLLHEIRSLQYRVNNLSIQKRKTSFACFKVKQRIIFGLAFIDTGNLVHSAIVSGDFWETIMGKISSPMDHRVETVNGQSGSLQVIGVGEPWSIYLEGMEECYVLEPLVILGWVTVWTWGCPSPWRWSAMRRRSHWCL